MELWKRYWHKIPRPLRRIIVFVVGIVFITAGAVMLLLPGPGWATILLGLTIIATEFERAEKARMKVVKKVKSTIDKQRNSAKR